MRRERDNDRDDMYARPSQPILPTRPTTPQVPAVPPYVYPPGTVYNPIGVPPYAAPTTPYTPTPVRPIEPGIPRVVPGVPRTTPGTPPIIPPVTEPEIDFEFEPGPPVTTDTAYIQGYLKTVIGRYIRVDFIVGTNMFVDREGTLIDVGVDHIVLREPETDDHLIADLYSIKFVKVYY